MPANVALAGTYGPRILRLYEAVHFSVHDIALVDCEYLTSSGSNIPNWYIAPAFHFTMDTCTSGEVYNLIIRGGNEGGLDGIDVWGTNIHVHDVEVTNKDECVTVKSPASDMLIENIYCNWSGGSAMGSLGANTGMRSPKCHSKSFIDGSSNLQHHIPEYIYRQQQPNVYDQV